MGKRWKGAEEHVIQTLEKEFGVSFKKRVIRFENLCKKQFDAVSGDEEILAMVKAFDKPYRESTSSQLKTRQDRCIVDCAWLVRTSASVKLMVFIEKDYADWFRAYAEFLFPDVVVRWVPGFRYSTEKRPSVLRTLQQPDSRPLISESSPYEGKRYLYWWDIPPSRRDRLEEVGKIVFRKKDSGQECVVESERLLLLLTPQRQTSRNKRPWGIRVLIDHPDELAIEPGPGGRGGRAYLPVKWVTK